MHYDLSYSAEKHFRVASALSRREKHTRLLLWLRSAFAVALFWHPELHSFLAEILYWWQESRTPNTFNGVKVRTLWGPNHVWKWLLMLPDTHVSSCSILSQLEPWILALLSCCIVEYARTTREEKTCQAIQYIQEFCWLAVPRPDQLKQPSDQNTTICSFKLKLKLFSGRAVYFHNPQTHQCILSLCPQTQEPYTFIKNKINAIKKCHFKNIFTATWFCHLIVCGKKWSTIKALFLLDLSSVEEVMIID